VVVIGWGIMAYNNLVRQRQLSQEGWVMLRDDLVE